METYLRGLLDLLSELEAVKPAELERLASELEQRGDPPGPSAAKFAAALLRLLATVARAGESNSDI